MKGWLFAIVLGGCTLTPSDVLSTLFPTAQEVCEGSGGTYVEIREKATGKPDSVRYECRR